MQELLFSPCLPCSPVLPPSGSSAKLISWPKDCLEQTVVQESCPLRVPQHHLEGLLAQRFGRSRSGMGPRICLCCKFPCDVGDLEITL